MKILSTIITILILGFTLMILAQQCDSITDEIKNISKDDKCINGYVWSKHTNNTMMYKHQNSSGNFVECIKK